jgi:glycosyltransferase involved in cell wall biosynthesis
MDLQNPTVAMTPRTKPFRVCYFGTYRQEYSRNQIMIEGLRQTGVIVTECHVTLWRSIEDRVQAASGGWLRLGFIGRVLRAYWLLLQQYHRVGDYDIMVVGYPGQFDVFLARLLTWLRRKPLVWDIFMSIYLVAMERGLEKHSRVTINLLRRFEWAACRLPDRLILDTLEYVEWFRKIHAIPPERFCLVPTGADSRVFHPLNIPVVEDDLFRVLYYGTYIPNHGVKYIVEAARLLKDDPYIRFELVGNGPERVSIQKMVTAYNIHNLTFVDWLEKADLVEHIWHTNVCLGAFGTTPQSMMTVQNKIYEGLAMAKPVITGDSPAIRGILQHGKTIFLCERENPQSLAKAIINLREDADLRKELACQGYTFFLQNFSFERLGGQVRQYLEQICAESK